MNLREAISFFEGIALALATVFIRSNLRLGITIVVLTIIFNLARGWAGPLRPSS
jgi:hypothetical protein